MNGRIRYGEGTPGFVTDAIEAAYRDGGVQKVSIVEIINPEVFAHYPRDFFDRIEKELRWKLSDGLAAKGLQVLVSTGLVWQTMPHPGASELAREFFTPVVWDRVGDPNGVSMGNAFVELTVRAVAIPEITVPIGEW